VALERQLGWHTAVSVSYLHSRGQSLPTFIDTNLPKALGTVTYIISDTTGGGASFGLPANGTKFTLPLYAGTDPRPNSGFAQMTAIQSRIRSNYNALVVQVNRSFSRGLQFSSNYTWSHSIDNGQNSTTFTANNSPFDQNNIQIDKGSSNFNFPQRFVANLVWSPTISKDANPVLRAIFSDYSISPIVTISSGYPFSAFVSGNVPNSLAAQGAIVSGGTGTGIIGSGGTNRFPFLSRNSVNMGAIKNVDVRLSRQFSLTERFKIQLLGEVFNLFNRQQPNGVNTTAYGVTGGSFDKLTKKATSTLTYRTNFGQLNSAGSTLYRERQVQIGARFTF